MEFLVCRSSGSACILYEDYGKDEQPIKEAVKVGENWAIEVKNLKQLIDIINKYGDIIIKDKQVKWDYMEEIEELAEVDIVKKGKKKYRYEIEIYDSYRE